MTLGSSVELNLTSEDWNDMMEMFHSNNVKFQKINYFVKEHKREHRNITEVALQLMKIVEAEEVANLYGLTSISYVDSS